MRNSLKTPTFFDRIGIARPVALRIALVVGCVVALRFPGMALDYVTAQKSKTAARVDATALPKKLGNWVGDDKPLNERLNIRVGASTVADREYIGPSGRRIQVHVAEFELHDVTLPHSPTLCYPGAGWKIQNDRWRRVDSDHRYRLMTVYQELGPSAAVGYWYQIGPHICSTRDDLRRVFQQYRWEGKATPSTVKVLLHTDTERPNYKEDLDELSTEIYEWIKAET